MPSYVIDKITDGLNDHSLSVKGAKILVLGAAYKKNVDDMRESPSVEIMESLIDLGALVDYYDPFVPKLPKMRNHELDLESIEFNSTTVSSFDCILIATDHDGVDYSLLEDAKLVVDSRGLMNPNADNLVRA
jgi:UDP-N-acetyl-D-glucosamine dehydrogenase